MTKTIHHEVTLPATPAAVRDALLDAAKHGAFTGEPAEIDARVGGSFRCYGGKVEGIFLALTDNLIVQAWRPANFPSGSFTLASYDLEPVSGGTKLTFTQTSVPESAYAHLDRGWHERYWQPLTRYLGA